MIPYDAINAAALAAFPSLVREWFPAGKRHGREFKVGDIQGTPGESLAINLETGKWSDFATELKGGDPVSLLAAAQHGGNQADAARELAERFAIYLNGDARPKPAPAKSDDDWTPMPPPDSTPTKEQLGTYDMLHVYRDPDGNRTHYVRRLERSPTRLRKLFSPLTYGCLNGKVGWHAKHVATPAPLFGLEHLAARPDAEVVIHEGEKKSILAAALFPDKVHVAWSRGAKSVSYTDWMPLRSRTTIIWPDNDNSGHTAAAWLSGELPHARILEVRDLPEGHDAGDVQPDNPEAWLRERLRADARRPEAEPERPKARLLLEVLTPASISKEQARPYVMKGLIARGDHVVAMGQPGSGKSVVIPHIAYAVAQGTGTVFGRRVRGGPIIYVAAEDGHGMKNRVRALLQRHGDAPDFHLVPQAVDLMTDGLGRSALIELVATIKPVLIVLDTVGRSFPGLRENESDDMGKVVRAARELAEICSSAVISVHHVAKDSGMTPRGHGCLNGDADATLLIEGSGREVRTVRMGKNRNGSSDITFAFTIEVDDLGLDEDGDPITAPVAEEAVVDPDAGKAQREAKLADKPALLLRALRNIDPRQIESVRPQPDMPMVQAVSRERLRSVLIAQGWFPDNEVCGGNKLVKPGFATENNAFSALKRKGYINFDRKWIWLCGR